MKKRIVRLRNGFSDRNGIMSENNCMQYKEFDERTRVKIINVINKVFCRLREKAAYYDINFQYFLKNILADLYCEEVDWNADYDEDGVLKIIRSTICEDSYDAVLTTIEYIVDETCKVLYDNTLYGVLNVIFESEYVGYRFVNNKIMQITDVQEISEIEQAIVTDSNVVREHINKAIDFLSNRLKPDYENSIKESISAVESVCVCYVGKSSLGSALHKLEQNGIHIHGALKDAFLKLYGWTSDAKGIRHAGDIGGKNSTFEEAKFMLVTCCAFINYINAVSKD